MDKLQEKSLKIIEKTTMVEDVPTFILDQQIRKIDCPSNGRRLAKNKISGNIPRTNKKVLTDRKYYDPSTNERTNEKIRQRVEMKGETIFTFHFRNNNNFSWRVRAQGEAVEWVWALLSTPYPEIKYNNHDQALETAPIKSVPLT